MSTAAVRLYGLASRLLAGRGLRRYAWVNRRNADSLSSVKASEAGVLGQRLLLDRLDSLELSVQGIYEPLETKVSLSLIPAGGCAVDIGANIGYYALLFARA